MPSPSPLELATVGAELRRFSEPFSSWLDSVLGVVSSPPAGPSVDDGYLVGTTATGAWAGHTDELARWDGTAWRFIVPREGSFTFNRGTHQLLQFDGAAWVDAFASAAASRANKRMVALTTGSDGDLAVAVAVAGTPTGYVGVRVNGVDEPGVGDGTRVGASVYFSGDGGATARAWSAIQIGDTAHWQGTNAGYELAPTDVIEFVYEESGS